MLRFEDRVSAEAARREDSFRKNDLDFALRREYFDVDVEVAADDASLDAGFSCVADDDVLFLSVVPEIGWKEPMLRLAQRRRLRVTGATGGGIRRLGSTTAAASDRRRLSSGKLSLLPLPALLLPLELPFLCKHMRRGFAFRMTRRAKSASRRRGEGFYARCQSKERVSERAFAN